VLGRHEGSYWRLYELDGAFVANGRRLRGFFRPVVCQFVNRLYFPSCKELTDMKCVPKLAF
jgi:hypothetical protein